MWNARCTGFKVGIFRISTIVCVPFSCVFFLGQDVEFDCIGS